MGFRLRPRFLDRCRLAKVLLILLIAALIYGSKQRVTWSSHAHEISSPSTADELVAAILFGKGLTAIDASQPQYAQALCREHNLNIFNRRPVPKPGTGSSKRKVFDLLTVDTELDWLEIRLNSTYDFVDYFIIVEGRKTITGKAKPLLLKANWDRFSAYHNKMIYHELEHTAETKRHKDLESLHRNAPFTQVFPRLTGDQSPTQGDVLLVADVDELVRPEALLVLRACETPRRLTLHSKLYNYSFQFLHRGMDWPHPQATTYQGLNDTLLPDDLRKGEGGGAGEWGRFFAPVVSRWPESGDLWNAGWHCASCFATADEVVRTMDEGEGGGRSQVLVNAPRPHQQRRGMMEGSRWVEDLQDGDVFERIEHNEDVPFALRADAERWALLLDRNGTSAEFEDHYPDTNG